jgi:hypothetical protein
MSGHHRVDFQLDPALSGGEPHVLPSLSLFPLVDSFSGCDGDSGLASEVAERQQMQSIEFERQTHTDRMILHESMTEGKGTEIAYLRHVENYEVWWAGDQGERQRRDPSWVAIPAHPITATKVAAFLKHESTRPNVGCPV